MGTPNMEPQDYSRNIIEYKDPGRYIPIIFLLYSWGSLFGVPIKVPSYPAYAKDRLCGTDFTAKISTQQQLATASLAEPKPLQNSTDLASHTTTKVPYHDALHLKS